MVVLIHPQECAIREPFDRKQPHISEQSRKRSDRILSSPEASIKSDSEEMHLPQFNVPSPLSNDSVNSLSKVDPANNTPTAMSSSLSPRDPDQGVDSIPPPSKSLDKPVNQKKFIKMNSNAYIFDDTYHVENEKEDSEEEMIKTIDRIDGMVDLDKEWNFERYDEIGRGGFGVIYKVKDLETDEIYAQKVLEAGKLKVTEKSAKRQFLVEAKVLVMCPHHEHIIKLVHAEEDSEKQEYIITLELAPYGSVKDHFAGKIPIEEPIVQNLTKQILLGLRHLHENNIIYRDMKLSNLLLLNKDPLHLKIADFGISKIFEDLEIEPDENFENHMRRVSKYRTRRYLSSCGSNRSLHSTSSRDGSPPPALHINSSMLPTISENEDGNASEKLDSPSTTKPNGNLPLYADSPVKSHFEPDISNGFAEFVSEESSSPKKPPPRATELVGTLFYQPPEMLMRTGHSFKMDIWSLGIIVWQMVIGGMPFLLRDKKQIKRIMKRGLRFPPDISEEGEDFLRRCLTHEADRMDVHEALNHPWIKDVEINLQLYDP